MNQAQEYLARFRQAEIVSQQRTVAEAYQAHYGTLPADERLKADSVMQVLWPEINNEVAELERLTQLAQQQLAKSTVRA